MPLGECLLRACAARKSKPVWRRFLYTFPFSVCSQFFLYTFPFGDLLNLRLYSLCLIFRCGEVLVRSIEAIPDGVFFQCFMYSFIYAAFFALRRSRSCILCEFELSFFTHTHVDDKFFACGSFGFTFSDTCELGEEFSCFDSDGRGHLLVNHLGS